jgi:hypothetical protein
MAQGDVVFFDQFLVNLALGPDIGHDFGATPNVIKCALVTSVITPTEATADPCWGAGGLTNFLAQQVTIAGDYVDGGNICSSPTVTLNAGQAEFDWGDPNPWATGTDTDAKWAIIYDDTTANKNCIGFADLGPAFDMSAGTLTVTWGTPVATLNQAV